MLGRLRLLSSQYFSWAVLTLRELVPLSRTGTDITELRDLVLEEAAVLVGRVQGRVVLVPGRVHVVHVDECIRVLATWRQEHVLDADSLSILPKLV